ncbi:MAG: hypothetical protein COT43_03475 [Candidatus Marinimicrobia bacterium CG08_land_8_20_14_0_20_45_22]|nr:MAG: hypothetical protein COT43_03475 [Candidatus Marinimicrobia bacterium CG08_land_8_20_14_0_20_45_22]
MKTSSEQNQQNMQSTRNSPSDNLQKKSLVALVKCKSYDFAEVESAVERGIELLGGLSALFQKGESIILKPNLLSRHKPEYGVTTHPAVFRAVAKKLLSEAINASYGDSPPADKFANISQVAGLTAVAKELKIPVADFETGTSVYSDGGEQRRQFNIASSILSADGLINLPKLKTHHLTRLTGAVKNLFGCVPGFQKPEFHVKLPAVADFSKMLVDLNLLIRQRLVIMDAVQAMQGNGPTFGSLVPLHLLILSTDPVSVDSTACRIINVPPELVLTNYYGEKFGLGNMEAENITIVGDPISDFYRPDFIVQRSQELRFNQAWKYRLTKNYVSTRPVIDSKKCTLCGACVRQCPMSPKALNWTKGHNRPPKYDYTQCIRCFCCQEVCPSGAITGENPLLRRMIEKMYRLGVL